MKTTHTISKKEKGKRLDQWLASRLGISRNRVKRLIDSGNIRVAGKKVSIASWELREGDRVDIQQGEEKERGSRSARFLKVYLEDRDVIIVEKPAGILSVAEMGEKEESFLDHVKAYLKRKYRESGGVFVAPLHRLDRETSGIMVFARSTAGKNLEKEFREHRITRRYIAIVNGPVDEETATINQPLEKGEYGHGRKMKISKKGQRAITSFRVRERYHNATLLDIDVQTGRTHQIRVHLAFIGHPVVGDKVYGGENQQQLAFPRQALHASFLGFRHPATKKYVECRSPLPRDMKRLVDQLRGI